MKFGFDVHGVIDKHPDVYRAIMASLVYEGHEVHVITGLRQHPEGAELLKELKIPYTHYFSIIDFHTSIGTPIEWRNGLPYMDNDLWNSAKVDYCDRENIQMLFDDSPVYKDSFKNSDTIFAHQINHDRVDWRGAE